MATFTPSDILIIGAGIAGASVARFIGVRATPGTRAKVVLLERESQPGYHSTGRSAALFTETYGSDSTRALTVASRTFMSAPPPGFAAHPLLTPRGVLLTGADDRRETLEEALRTFRALVPNVRALDGAEACRMVPVLRPSYARHAILEPDAMDIDVHAVHRGYLREAAASGTRLVCDAEVRGIERIAGAWEVDTPAGRFRAPILINAAGAWADTIARLAGLAPLGIQPCRRTAFTFDAPPDPATGAWPMVIDADEAFYFKPDAGRLLGSLADETPSEPCDARPEELDIAIAVDRIETATTLSIRRLVSSWAGLRCFAPDRCLIAGFDPAAEGFLWLAGQGGYGIQTSPAMGMIGAALASGDPFPESVAAYGVRPADLAPGRFRQPASDAGKHPVAPPR
jgi:D-arginine dehydrogenase